MDHFLKIFIEFVTILLLFCFSFLVMRHVGSWLPNQGTNLQSLHWPSREVLGWDY